MGSQGEIRPGRSGCSLCQHSARACADLFSGLKHKPDETGPAFSLLAQNFCKCQPDSHMPIMPASMHHPRHFGDKIMAVFFLHWQSVHVETQQHVRPGSITMHLGQNARFSNRAFYRPAQAFQTLHDESCRMVFMEAQFGMFVQVSAVGYHAGSNLADFTRNFHYHFLKTSR
jgi:hypothetical protein